MQSVTRRIAASTAATIAALVPVGVAAAQEHAHGDVSPRVAAGKIVTDEYLDGAEQLTPNVRVFAYDFQETVEDPYAINDPGFNALAGSGLPVGSRVGVEPVQLPATAGGVTALAYWDGVTTTTPGGAPAFGPAPQGESLTLNFLSQNRSLSSAAAVPSGFVFGPAVGAGGAFHEHLNALLIDGPGASPIPLDGVYLIGLRITSDSSAIEDSEPAYFVFNNGLTEDQHDAAIDFVSTSVVPEPASAALVALGASATLLRRGRRCKP